MLQSCSLLVFTQSNCAKRTSTTGHGLHSLAPIICIALFLFVAPFITAASAEDTSERIWINDGDGLRNGSFEHWVEGVPMFWNVSPEFKALLIKHATSIRTGNTSLGFRGNCEECWATTELKFDRPPSGLTVVFTIQARTSQTDGLHTFIDYGETTGRSISSLSHPGDGRWHVFEQALTLPRDFTKARIKVGFRYTGQSEKALWGVLDDAVIHVLPDVATHRRELIRDTRFRHWNDGAPEGWRVLKGKVTRNTDPSKETSSIRLDASGSPKGEEVKLQFPLELYTFDAGKTLRIQFAAKGPQRVLRHALFGNVDGKMVPFAYGTSGKKGYTSISTSEEWSETTTDFLVPENIAPLSTLLFIVLNPTATQPVEIQHVSAIVIPDDPKE